jgi:general nucleoside transport system permease protein
VTEPLGGGGAHSLVKRPTAAEAAPAPSGRRVLRFVLLPLGIVAALALVAQITGARELTSAGTWGAAFRLGVPILLAGLGGLFAERVGVINIGLEGMMILGTWFGAWAAWMYGPWWGVLAALIGGALGGLLHAVATVHFGVDHIISGVAINILAAGVARFLSVITYVGVEGGGATQSPRFAGRIASVNLPFLAGGNVFGWQSPDLFGWVARQQWIFVSDLAALGRGLTSNVSLFAVLAVALVPLAWWVLWRSPLGLRMRSVGEHPEAAESLGVSVYSMKYLGLTISGALAGLGGGFLVLEAAGIYREMQTGGRGFIGLAAMIFGNWRPSGVLVAAGLFGYADALRLRQEVAVHGLLLLAGGALIVVALWALYRRRAVKAGVLGLVGIGFLVWWTTTDTVPREFVFFTPYVVTLIVLAFAAQHLRPPAAIGKPYRRRQAH